MARGDLSDPMTGLAPLLDGTPEEQQRWVEGAAASLSPQLLLAIEQQACQIIDQRYPDDPGSLFNWRYREGQRRKRALQRLFDYAHHRLTEQQLGFVEQTRTTYIRETERAVADALKLQRRPLSQALRQDYLEFVRQVKLATNADLQAELALAEQQERLAEAAAGAEHRRAIQLRQVEARIQRAVEAVRQPYELQLKLYDVLTILAEYQMSLQDRASRNPALAERLLMMANGITTVMAAVQHLMGELNRNIRDPVAQRQLEQQTEGLLNLAMEQFRQWQQEITREAPRRSRRRSA